ncbi:PPBT-like protein [Mya arenaria]|uniref:alkaline phosphatase n=1 Tax=Mya arenaria TaxID=6604 RepID=A0ABY7EX41_MYAAR|nr:PPBT-like protein [Mya arenaria]
MVGIYAWLVLVVTASLIQPTVQVRDATFYQNAAKKDLLNKLRNRENKRVAKNIILFIGDGMGMSTVTAARIRKGQLEGYPGEETVLNFERFPYVGLSKVYCEDVQVPDSACTATALFTGVKTNFEMLRLDASTSLNDSCVDPAKGLPGLLQWSQAAGYCYTSLTSFHVTEVVIVERIAAIAYLVRSSQSFV